MQITGDVLSVTSESGLLLLPLPLPRMMQLGGGLKGKTARSRKADAASTLPHETIEFLMPPQVRIGFETSY